MNEAYGSYGTPTQSWPHVGHSDSVSQLRVARLSNAGGLVEGGQKGRPARRNSHNSSWLVTGFRVGLRIACPGNGMLENSLCRLHEVARERKWLGLSEKQVADEEIEQLDLISSPGRIKNVRN